MTDSKNEETTVLLDGEPYWVLRRWAFLGSRFTASHIARGVPEAKKTEGYALGEGAQAALQKIASETLQKTAGSWNELKTSAEAAIETLIAARDDVDRRRRRFTGAMLNRLKKIRDKPNADELAARIANDPPQGAEIRAYFSRIECLDDRFCAAIEAAQEGDADAVAALMHAPKVLRLFGASDLKEVRNCYFQPQLRKYRVVRKIYESVSRDHRELEYALGALADQIARNAGLKEP